LNPVSIRSNQGKDDLQQQNNRNQEGTTAEQQQQNDTEGLFDCVLLPEFVL